MGGIKYVELINDIINYSIPLGFNLAFKTTATKLNKNSLFGIYSIIKNSKPDYWKVYQFRSLNNAGNNNDRFNLNDQEFLYIKEKLICLNEEWIKPISRKDGHQPYIFLDNKGNLSTVHPIIEQNIPISLEYKPEIRNASNYIQALHRNSRKLPDASECYGEFLSINRWRNYAEQKFENNISNIKFAEDLLNSASTIPNEIKGLLDSLAGNGGTITIRIRTATRPEDLLDENGF